jgi:hypothetical protein
MTIFIGYRSFVMTIYENEDASHVETLLAVGEGTVKKRRRPHRGEDFKFR